MHQFADLAEARARIEAWRVDDNEARPHGALGHLTPKEFTAKRQEHWDPEGARLELTLSANGTQVSN